MIIEKKEGRLSIEGDQIIQIYSCNDSGYPEPGYCTMLVGASGYEYISQVSSYFGLNFNALAGQEVRRLLKGKPLSEEWEKYAFLMNFPQ